ncbi:MAG: SIS domain-containing protein [Thermodesulfobacteriota bacterium]|nr:SIS domain-containing protein [Thermodesulfobacteriota bacterium]
MASMPSTFINNYVTGLTIALEEISGKEFEDLISALDRAYRREANIFVFGNGGSGTTASHFACDMNKGFSCGKARKFRVMCLNENLPTLLAYANDVSYDDVFVEQLKNFMGEGDLVIGVSGSGNSENVVKAVSYASEYGAVTFGICGFGGGRLKDVAEKALVTTCDDMQKIEDIHLIILHCAMQWFEEAYKSDI